MNLKPKYRIQHFLLIIFLIIGLTIGLLKLQSMGFLDSFPMNGFYKIAIIYFVMIVITAYVYKTRLFSIIHQHIGFQKTNLKYILIAIVGTFVIWGLDYLFQNHFFPNEIQKEALKWHNNNKDSSLYLTFLSIAFMVPIVEEMLFRGITLKTARHYLSNTWALIIISFLFVLVHYSFNQSVTLFIAAIFYGILAIRSKSLYPSICAHILNNSLTLIYYIGIV